eukprot:1899099-Pleurochrysis_carterae.AAC.1
MPFNSRLKSATSANKMRMDVALAVAVKNFRHFASVTYSPICHRVETGWPHLYGIVHLYISMLPER